MKKINKRILYVAVIVLSVVLYMAFRSGFSNEEDVVYKTDKLKKSDLRAVVNSTGTLNPVTTVEIGSQVSGIISRIYVDYNSEVKEGDILAEIDPETIKTKILQQRANLKSADAGVKKSAVNVNNIKAQLERMKKMFKEKLISVEELESVQAQYDSAVADHSSSKAKYEQVKSQLDSEYLNLKHTVIKSPIDGIVISRDVNTGQTVTAGFQTPKLFEIAADLTKMQLECSIDEADIGRIRTGQKVEFTVDAFSEEKFKGEIVQKRVSPVIESNVVTYTTIAYVENPDNKLLPGMTATVDIVTELVEDKFTVPNNALRFEPSLTVPEIEDIMEKFMSKMKKNGRGRRPGNASGMKKRNANVKFVKIWFKDKDGISFMPVRSGISNDTRTVIYGKNIKEGMEILVSEDVKNSKGRIKMSEYRPGRGSLFMRRR